MRFAASRQSAVEITLTPLIDILFIVLLFLVLTATFTEQTVLRIALPRAATGDRPSDAPGTVRIMVDADGTIALDGEIRTLDGIERRLRTIRDRDGTRVVIAADEQAHHGHVIQVIDRVRQAGIFRLDIETRTPAAQRRSP